MSTKDAHWPRQTDRNGLSFFETRWGSAYGKAPPTEEPLTAAEVLALPHGAEVLVLWGGGNGCHRYRLQRRHGLLGTVPPDDDAGLWFTRIDAGQIGRDRMANKFWRAP